MCRSHLEASDRWESIGSRVWRSAFSNTMNLPNQLTVLRLVLTVPFVVALSIDFPGSKILALALFVIGSVTDYADGYIARKYQLITDFGKLMDPLVDKIMTAAAFICLVALSYIPAWAVIVIVGREFLITGLRLIAVSRGKVLPAERLGKHKTVWQIVTILYFLVVAAVTAGGRMSAPFLIFGWFLIIVTVGLTLWSGVSYLVKNRELISGG
jgi:CDP-diacylglycerol--glycerol-3-phosphate 3-phosphatidyltransferase